MRPLAFAVLCILIAVSAFAQAQRRQSDVIPPTPAPAEAQPAGQPSPAPPPTGATAQKPPAPPEGYVPLPMFPAPPAEEKKSVTHHLTRIDGQEVHYTATAGTLVLKRDDDKPKATIFYIAYTRDDVTDKSKRPVTYTFNGGPGSSSVWLHMGAIGPKRVLLKDDGSLPPAPFRLIDNEFSILDVTDLVFIDPVSTGFSRNAPGENPAQFHGVREDLSSVGDFIRLWTTRNERWSSPKFLAGESYGTTRAAGLSDYLLQTYGMYLNGITLISSILNFETADFNVGNDLPYITFLPTYAAIAWYHKKLSPDLQADFQKTIHDAKQFAQGDYTLALMKGDKLPAEERTHVAGQLARFTGLSSEYVELSNLRVQIQRFAKELLRNERRTVGRYDGRMEGIDLDAAGEFPEYDPSYSVVYGPFSATFNDYVRSDLKVESDEPYEILTGKVQPWNYAPFQNRYVNMAEPLRQAITQNPNLHVMVCNGYFDMATPFYATEYTFDHLGLDPKLTGNVSMTYYEAGHMFYTNKASAAQLRKNLVDFYGRYQ